MIEVIRFVGYILITTYAKVRLENLCRGHKPTVKRMQKKKKSIVGEFASLAAGMLF